MSKGHADISVLVVRSRELEPRLYPRATTNSLHLFRDRFGDLIVTMDSF
jgi:hypothetical protein